MREGLRHSQAERLIILDDDPSIGHTIQAIAQSAGLEGRFTTDPEELFRALDEWKPGYIALDLVMPQMDGVEVLAELGRRKCQARVIITSGMGTRVLDAAGRSAADHGLRIIGVLAKPFAPSRLRELLTCHEKADAPPSLRKSAGARPAEDQISEGDLRTALAQREIRVAYQPKVACSTRQLTGVEALARWRHPVLGPIPPDQFILLAESAGLIDQLTEQVLDQAMHWYSSFMARASQRHEYDKLALSINLSARSMRNTSLIDSISERCERYRIHPRSLIFELTETSAMDDPVASLDLLTRLRMKGYYLSLDDFGTGFSSMVQLVRLPFSEIKVDKSFVMDLARSGEARTIVKSIVDLGRNLGLKTTAEGVENMETLQYLRSIQCDMAQGFFIARPMAADALEEWIGQHRNQQQG